MIYRSYRSYTKFLSRLYITVYLARIRTYKNADEKAHTFSRRSKNVKKLDEKRVLCKFTFRNQSQQITKFYSALELQKIYNNLEHYEMFQGE